MTYGRFKYRTNALRTYVYRLYAATGELLYVGMTGNVEMRLRAHRASKLWAVEIARIDVTPYADRVAALDAERQAILSESPTHNIQHRSVKSRLHTFRVSDELWNEARARTSSEGISISEVARAGLRDYLEAE